MPDPDYASFKKNDTNLPERVVFERYPGLIYSRMEHSRESEEVSSDEDESEIFEEALSNFPDITNRHSFPDPLLDIEDISLSEQDIWYESRETQPPNVAQQLLTHLLTRALFLTSGELLARTAELKDLWEQLRPLYSDGQLSRLEKAKRLAHALRQFNYLIPERWQGVIDQVIKGIELVHDIQRISFSHDAGMMVGVEQGIDQIQRLLERSLVREALSDSQRQVLTACLTPIRQTLASLQAFWALPDNAPFDDYLKVIRRILTDPQMGAGLAPDLFIDTLEKVEQLTEQVRSALNTVDKFRALGTSCPTSGSLDVKMAWLLQVLAVPEIQGVLDTYLPPDSRVLLNQILPWFRQINSYPAEGAFSQQASWLIQQAGDPATQALIRKTPLQPMIERITQQFSGDASSMGLLKALLQLTDPKQSAAQKVKQLIAPLVTRQTLAQSVKMAARYTTGYTPLLLDAWDWYQRQPAGLSWEQTLTNFIEEIRTHPEQIVLLLPPALQDALKGLSWLADFPKGGSWKETLEWAVKAAPQFPQLQSLYNRFIELSLAKAVYDALQQTGLPAQERALQQVAKDLAAYWPDLATSGGGMLTAIIPLLPGLLGLGKDVYQLPTADSWLDWVSSVLGIIKETNSPALQQLEQQLQTLVENWFVSGLTSGLDSATEAASTAWSAGANKEQPLTVPPTEAASSSWNYLNPLSWLPSNDLLKFPVVSAVDNVVLPVHVAEKLQMAGPGEAMTLYGQMSPVNQAAFNTRYPDLTEQITRPHELARSSEKAVTTALTVPELEACAPSDNDDDYFIESPVDDSLYDPHFQGQVLSSSPKDTYSAAQKTGGAALAAWWLGTAYVAYKTYAKHRAYTQKRTAFAKETAEPKELESLNPVSLEEGAAGEQATVENTARPLVAEPADNVTLDMPQPVEEPRYSYTLPSVLTAMTLAGAVGTGAYVYNLLPQNFDDSELFNIDNIPELKALLDAYEPSNLLAQRDREKRSTNKELTEQEILDLLDCGVYSDTVNLILKIMVGHAVEYRKEYLISKRDLRRPENPLRDVYCNLILRLFNRINNNKNLASKEIISALIISKRRLERLFREKYKSIADVLFRKINTIFPDVEPFIIAHEASYTLQEVFEREYIDAVGNFYKTNTVIAQTGGALEGVYSQAVGVAESIFGTFIVKLFKKRLTLAESKNTLADFLRRQIQQYGDQEDKTLKSPDANTPDGRSWIAYISMIKYHFTVLFNNSQKFFDILSLLKVNELYGLFSGDRAVFEAQIQAAKITIKTFGLKGDSDADLSNDECLDAYIQMKGMSEEIVNYLDMAAAFIYAVFMKNVSLNIATSHRPEGYEDEGMQERYMPWRMIQNFSAAESRVQTLMRRMLDKPPEGFKGITAVKRSSEFGSWAEYYAQFSIYTSNYLEYESKLYSQYVSAQANFDDYRMSHLIPQKVELLDLCGLKIDEKSIWGASGRNKFTLSYGVIGFIKMTTGEVLVVTAINGRPRVRFYTKADVDSNTTLGFIFSGGLVKFTTPYKLRRNGFKDYIGNADLEGTTLNAGPSKHHGRSAKPLSGPTAVNNVLKELFKEGNPPWGDSTPYLYVKSERFDDPHVETKSRDDIDVSGRALIHIIDDIMRVNLRDLSGALKIANEESTMWGLFASNFIPFYDVIRKSVNDSDYQVSSEEITSNLFQLVLLLIPYGMNIKTVVGVQLGVFRTAVMHALKQGLKGKTFVKAVVRSMAENHEFAAFPILRRIQYMTDVSGAPLPLKIRLKLLSRIRKVTAAPPATNVPPVRQPAGLAMANAANDIILGEGKTIRLREAAPNLGLANPLAVSERSLAVGRVPEGTPPVAPPVAPETSLVPREPRMQIDALCRPVAGRGKRDTTPVCPPYTPAEQAEIDALAARITPLKSASTRPLKERVQQVHADLRQAGYTDVHYGSLGIWRESARDSYVRHVVFATKNQVEMTVDLAIADFYSPYGLSDGVWGLPIESTKKNWFIMATHTYENNNILVKYSTIRSDYLDDTVFSNINELSAFTPVEGAEILVTPFWYKAASPLKIASIADSTSLNVIDSAINIARQARETVGTIQATEAWKFPIEVQQRATLLSGSEASTLSASRTPPTLETYLGMSPLTITGQDQMLQVPKAARIAFSEEGHEQVMHGMISTGEGRAIGIHNEWLDPLYGAATREVDLVDDLVWKEDGAYLPKGNKKIIIKAQSSAWPILKARHYEPHTAGYRKDYAINIEWPSLGAISSKLKLKFGKARTRVQTFSEVEQKYVPSKNFSVAPYCSLISEGNPLNNELIKTVVNDFVEKYRQLAKIAESYAGAGATDLRASLSVGRELVEGLLSKDEYELEVNIFNFALVEGAGAGGGGTITRDNILGLAKIYYADDVSTVYFQGVVAHPYTICTKYPEFMEYAAARITPATSLENMKKYKIKRIGGQLVRDGVKAALKQINSLADDKLLSRPKVIATQASNPITAQIAESFGGLVTRTSGAVGIEETRYVFNTAAVGEDIVYAGLAGENPMMRSVARSAISNNIKGTSAEFAIGVLKNSHAVSPNQAKALIQAAKANTIDALVDNSSAINTASQLLDVQPGQLIIFNSVENDELRHIMVGLGNGRFTGVNSDVLDTALRPGPINLVAEELGSFSDNRLVTPKGERITIQAGFAKGAIHPDSSSITPAGTNRVQALLGEEVGSFSGHLDNPTVFATAHGAPFNINNMDAIEFAHVIRGLALSKLGITPAQLMGKTLHLTSCRSAIGFGWSDVSSAQIIADELNVNVIAYTGTTDNLTAKLSDAVAETAGVGRVKFRPRLEKFNSKAILTPAETVEKINLIKKIEADRLLHMKFHNASAVVGRTIARFRARHLQAPESVQRTRRDTGAQYGEGPSRSEMNKHLEWLAEEIASVILRMSSAEDFVDSLVLDSSRDLIRVINSIIPDDRDSADDLSEDEFLYMFFQIVSAKETLQK